MNKIGIKKTFVLLFVFHFIHYQSQLVMYSFDFSCKINKILKKKKIKYMTSYD